MTISKEEKSAIHLLRWSDHVPVSDVQDPLGLSLRGSARLASRLLFCITSITPRARYFSFIPWCVLDWQKREKGHPFALGLSQAITLREKALALGCIAHHEGRPCAGGGLVGSESVTKWYRKGLADADLRKLPFAKNPALDAYFNSLLNLGFFVTDGDTSKIDETEEAIAQSFDDLELSTLGRNVAAAYEKRIGRIDAVTQVAAAHRRSKVAALTKWGERGGLCELADPVSPDRDLLRRIFLAADAPPDSSHFVRDRSLLLILELTRQLSSEGLYMDEAAFRAAVYFGEMTDDEGDTFKVVWPGALRDIATRWRMFYFHHYMSVALEGMFAWLVTQVGGAGLQGASVKELCGALDSAAVRKSMSETLRAKFTKSFGSTSPRDLFQQRMGGTNALDPDTSRTFDQVFRGPKNFTEEQLEDVIYEKGFAHSPQGLAVTLTMLCTTLTRYVQWNETNHGHWLATAASDPYVDIVPPVLTAGLERRFGGWWQQSWGEIAEFVLSRYVVQQHQSMSYEKTAKAERCLLQVDGNRITTRPNEVYEKIGVGNARFSSAVRILHDLGLLKNDGGIIELTNDGVALLTDRLGPVTATQ